MKTIGTMRMIDEHQGAIRVEDAYDTGIDDLWEACTDPARLKNWIADVAGGLQLGGTFHATFTSSGAGTGRVEACDAPQHLHLEDLHRCLAGQPSQWNARWTELTLAYEGMTIS